MAYLDTLDDLLRAGLDGLSRRFLDAQRDFVLSRQQPDGGFGGRGGPGAGSDLYYTDFALRCLLLTGCDEEPACRAAGFVASATPRDLIQRFTILNASRLLGHWNLPPLIDAPELATGILADLLPAGGFRAADGALEPSAYQTFLAWLALEIAELTAPARPATLESIAALQRPDGGFSERPSGSFGQTNATAAAVAVLSMADGLDESAAGRAADFLISMQSPDGGLRAHAAAPAADLLSTFTGALSLWGLNAFDRLSIPALARFLRSAAAPTGGFRAGPTDPEADVEYTWYGLALTALLRAAR